MITHPSRLTNLIEWSLFRNGPLTRDQICQYLISSESFGHEILNEDSLEAKVDQALRECLEIRNSIRPPDLSGSWRISGFFKGVPPNTHVKKTRMEPWYVAGNGTESVYCIFYTQDMNKASNARSVEWPIKVGKTVRDVVDRIEELQTASWDSINLGIHIKTDDSLHLERYIHRELHSSRIESLGGQEWFKTSLFRIKDIYAKYPMTNKTTQLSGRGI